MEKKKETEARKKTTEVYFQKLTQCSIIKQVFKISKD